MDTRQSWRVSTHSRSRELFTPRGVQVDGLPALQPSRPPTYPADRHDAVCLAGGGQTAKVCTATTVVRGGPSHPIIAAMPEQPPLDPLKMRIPTTGPDKDDDKVICERCGTAEMYRMHAVWRCPECGYKTDCCGW